MVSLSATLGIGCILLVATLALPQNRKTGTSAPNPAERSTSSLLGNINSMILPDLHLNTTISNPTPRKNPVEFWPVECGEETIPPGWLIPPGIQPIASPIDCRDAISRVTMGGQPREPQIWESQAEWCYHSCGVFLTPGWSYARVNFPRIDIAELAQHIARKCVNQEHNFMGGWVAIGGYFIVLVTGRESPDT